jgi:multicomponent Na+:H+ antiporter subunit A
MILCGGALAAAAPWLLSRAAFVARSFFVLYPLAILAALLAVAPVMKAGGDITFTAAWVPSLGVQFAFRLDALSWLFAVIVSGLGAMVALYSCEYFSDLRLAQRFWPGFLIFTASMLGLVLANDAILLFVFWELTSVASYLLITFYGERDGARVAGIQAFLVTGLGGLFLLTGLLAISSAAGTMVISEQLAQSRSILSNASVLWVLGCVLLGAITKSAQFPFHFWLPNAMVAPTPVSAFLHSASLVKAGIYLLLRYSPAFSHTLQWQFVLVTLGAVTFIFGALRAISQTDLKIILAQTTLSALGLMTLSIGMGHPGAIAAALTFLMAHALYKGGLFLIAGNLEHAMGVRNILEMGGLRKHMPLTFAGTALLVVAMMGLPPTLAFLSKELSFAGGETTFGLLLMALGNASIAAVGGMVLVVPFLRAPPTVSKIYGHPHDPKILMWIPPFVLGVLGVLLPLGSFGLIQVFQQALAIASPRSPTVSFDLWHGFGLEFFWSVVTWVLALLLFKYRSYMPWASGRAPSLQGSLVFRKIEGGILAFARWQTQALQTGKLRRYLNIIFVTLIVTVAWSLATDWTSIEPTITPNFSWSILVVPVALILIGAFLVVKARRSIHAVIALGIVGWGVALLFALHGAPDLAMTQIAVESLTVVLFAFVISRMPEVSWHSRRWSRIRDMVVATAVGTLMGGLTWLVVMEQVPSRLRGYFLSRSLSEGHGENVVNVILVDFRGLDTFGEIFVLGIAAIGICILLQPSKKQKEISP